MDRFYDLSEDTIDDFDKIFNKKSFPVSVKFQFIGDSKQKSLIKIAKIADDYSYILQKELKVSINEDLMNVFDEESITILFEQEIDKININLDSGKIKLVKTDLNTFSSLVNKYGVEKVARANKVEELYQEQKKMLRTKNLLFNMINTSELGQNYISALRKKYEAEIEEAKANLSLYVTNLSAIGEHSDLMEEHDKWITKYTEAKDKLESLNELFTNTKVIKG